MVPQHRPFHRDHLVETRTSTSKHNTSIAGRCPCNSFPMVHPVLPLVVATANARRPSPHKNSRHTPSLPLFATAVFFATIAFLLPSLAVAAEPPNIPPSPHIPDGQLIVHGLGCGGGVKALGPPSRPAASASGSGTTFAYWAAGCDLSGSSAPLRLRLNATGSDYGGGATEPPPTPPHETTVARVVLVTGSHFWGAAGGGVEVAGPSQAHTAMVHPLSPTAEWSDIWSAAPLNVTITNNTFAAGAVIRFVGALPPRSSLLIAGNTFTEARLLGGSGAFAAGNIFETYFVSSSSSSSLAPLHALILVTPHASDGGSLVLREGTTVNISGNTAATNAARWVAPHGVGNTRGDIGFAFVAVAAGTASSEGNVSLMGDATLSLSDNALRIADAYEALQGNTQFPCVIAAGLFLRGRSSGSKTVVLSGLDTSKVSIARNTASVTNSATWRQSDGASGTFRMHGALLHARAEVSHDSSINLDGNGASAHNCTSSVYVHGIYWESQATTTISGNASINFNSNSAAAHNCTSSVYVHGIQWYSQATTTSGNASINFNGNSAAAHNCTSSVYVHGIQWYSDATQGQTPTKCSCGQLRCFR